MSSPKNNSFLTKYFEQHPSQKEIWPKLRSHEYSFPLKSFDLEGMEMNYVDTKSNSTKDAPVILCVHGNPTWSFYYRSIAKHFSASRVIIPDHIGMGISSRPLNKNFTLDDRVNHLMMLIRHLNLRRIYLIVHDWGGPIGLLSLKRLLDEKFPLEFVGVTFLNTAVTKARHISNRIKWCRGPLQPIVKYAGIFNWGLPIFGSAKKLSSTAKAGLSFPYLGANSRQAVADFIRDIPLDSSDKSFASMAELEAHLLSIRVPVQLLWGEKDFCFDVKYYEILKSFFPKAKVFSWKDAGHLLLEDKPNEVCDNINSFMVNNGII
ncbi:MAG: alpha/beta fold hydrolase [Bacteriovoracaceae bacterium]|nr:alpha/beta fold hydrolase [Bacteriovoracaceae bacterium]